MGRRDKAGSDFKTPKFHLKMNSGPGVQDGDTIILCVSPPHKGRRALKNVRLTFFGLVGCISDLIKTRDMC
jgi:hypothetical protein